MPKSFNPNLIIANRSYTTEKICTLYKSQKLHPQTVRDFVHNEGLKVVSMKPIIILGKDLKDFLKSRNAHKRKLAFNEFKCAKCKAISEPQNKEISIYYNKNGSIRAVGICPVCGAELQRFYGASEETDIAKHFLVKPELTTLCNSLNTPLQTNIEASEEVPQHECVIDVEGGCVVENQEKNKGGVIANNDGLIAYLPRSSRVREEFLKLTLGTNIKSKQNHTQTALQTNINHEFQLNLF
jgi:hypothetical protein